MNLLADEIHLWFAYPDDISDDKLIAYYHTLLSEEERVKQHRFHFAHHQHQYLVSRALLRTTLSRYVPEIAPDKWQFSKNQFGKPAIENPEMPVNLSFNLSHADKLIFLAICSDAPLGIDVENIHRTNQLMDIARHYFAGDELQLLEGKSPDEQRIEFFKLWTLKEAYIKAKGKGLSIPLNQFSFAGQFHSADGDSPDRWQFWQQQMDDSHIVALAVELMCPAQRFSILMRQSVLDYPGSG